MELMVEQTDDITVVAVQAAFLDANNSREFKDRLLEVLEKSCKVVIDLQQIQFMDSSGCSAILTGVKKMTECGGNLKVCNITNPVRALFDMVRMQRIIDVCKTRDEALQAFARKNETVTGLG